MHMNPALAIEIDYKKHFLYGARSAIVLFWLSVAMELACLAVCTVDFNITFALLVSVIAFIALTTLIDFDGREVW